MRSPLRPPLLSHAIAMAPLTSSSSSSPRFVSFFNSTPHALLQWERKKAPAEGIGAQEDASVFILRGVKGKEHALPRKYLHCSVNSKGDAENKLDTNILARNTEKNGVDPTTSHAQEATSNGSDSTNGDTANNNGYATAFRPSSISVDNSHRLPTVDWWRQWSQGIPPPSH